MDNIKYSATQFSKSINLKSKKITFKKLLNEVRKKGYIVKSYSESATLLMAFGLYDDSKEADSVSTIDKDGVPYIFINDDIAEIYQLFTLAHELGHIILKHRKISSLKRQQEREADIFAHYLLSGNTTQKLNIVMGVICLFLCVCTLFISGFIEFPTNERIRTVFAEGESSATGDKTEISYNTVCYFTRNGTVYHLYKDCYYLKNHTEIYTNTIGECHLDKLCSACERKAD